MILDGIVKPQCDGLVYIEVADLSVSYWLPSVHGKTEYVEVTTLVGHADVSIELLPTLWLRASNLDLFSISISIHSTSEGLFVSPKHFT